MMDVSTFLAFSDEMSKTAISLTGIGRGAENAVRETGRIIRDSVDPRTMRKGLGEGLKEMSNMADSRKGKALTEKLRGRESVDFDPRGLVNKGLDWFRTPGGARASQRGARDAERVHKYTPDFHNDPSMLGAARRYGFLSNVAKYEGPSTYRRVKNMVGRALPGEVSVLGGLTAHDSVRSLSEKKDSSGRPVGVGERIGRTGVGLTSGIVGMRAGMVPMIASSIIGGSAGGFVGREVDKGVSLLKGKPGTGASPNPVGA